MKYNFFNLEDMEDLFICHQLCVFEIVGIKVSKSLKFKFVICVHYGH